jgi:hypothetical protein
MNRAALRSPLSLPPARRPISIGSTGPAAVDQARRDLPVAIETPRAENEPLRPS